jgi:hypothetical protein
MDPKRKGANEICEKAILGEDTNASASATHPIGLGIERKRSI